ncbi:3-oxo-tetronate 4-phosphate decarboxylase [Neorhodopirellula pilleata]|uniref:3-oxo-tetronate 4-phosphate decarboxylase n=1 Tax=Neorhodopirellula pilleata TaxID=2714738 RepID=A0A5C6A2P0_9BACT|nr:3-oxo-tetronate 4-phosphate decarboxylase [Neorhodopirellula pilleata]TWT93577.1 L-fuculose phosphate aldolase [Neorhodopirellula pilleata]
MSERELREQIVEHGRSLYARGLTAGSSGNISVRLPDGMLVTPTNSCLGRLEPDEITKLDSIGNVISGRPPSKEAFLHQAYYQSRQSERAVVHLHSTWSVAVSCLTDINPNDVLPPITAYFVMRVGRLPLIPYFPPGDEQLADAVARVARVSRGALLANHGPVIGAVDLDQAVYAIEELEETAKLFMILRGLPTRFLTASQAEKLNPS